tara:strand:- start:451 stop:990 length:540 start_codon:yes stop_codon:yes gene_type:complete
MEIALIKKFNMKKSWNRKSYKNEKKHCSKCNKYKILSDFGITKRNWDGKSNYCRLCENTRSREKNKRLSSKNIETYIKYNFHSYAKSAKSRKIKFTVTKEYLIELFYKQKGLCAVTRVKMTHKRGKGVIDTNLSLDRINPKKSYSINNLRWVCFIINILRLDMPDLEFKIFCKNILKNE